jgi:hypothetical protein
MATPKTSRAPAPTKTDRILSPVFRVGVGHAWTAEKANRFGLKPLGSFSSAEALIQKEQAALLIINKL